MHSAALIVFAKPPILGKVKSRIAKTLGEEKALEIYLRLLELTKQILVDFSKVSNCKVVIYWDSFIPENSQFKALFEERLQSSGDLGIKMSQAFMELAKEARDIAIIGTDCPYLQVSHLNLAFEAMLNGESCIGPAWDGGYYLLGLKEPALHWFEGIPWSTPEVFSLTKDKFSNLNLPLRILPQLRDIDTAEDWDFFVSG